MWHPSLDLGRLQRRDVNFLRDKSSGELFGVTLLARTPKEGLLKESKLGCIEDKNICPVCTLWDYCEASTSLRGEFNEDHKFFLVYINHPNKKTNTNCRINNWYMRKGYFRMAGVDTKQFKAHSTRSASSTKAFMAGIDMTKLKQHTNWSLRTNTFEKYYLKPPNQHEEG
ncbi:hypothetical protein G6F56_013898 [Rhizopus delemar]|nr:hypothetical protein G6F56_013898 [Rhizopus delemar]